MSSNPSIKLYESLKQLNESQFGELCLRLKDYGYDLTFITRQGVPIATSAQELIDLVKQNSQGLNHLQEVLAKVIQGKTTSVETPIDKNTNTHSTQKQLEALREQEEEDKQAWQIACQIDSIAAYQIYLDGNTLKQFANKAKKRLLELKEVGKLSALNPLDYLRLLWWVLFMPQQLRDYREKFGETDDRRVSKWLVSTLMWLPLLMLNLALGLEWLPNSNNTGSPETYLWISAGLVGCWLLVGWLGDWNENLTIFLEFDFNVQLVVAGIVAFGIAFGIASGMVCFLAIFVVCSLAFLVAVGVGMNSSVVVSVASLVAVFIAFNMMGILVVGMAGIIAVIMASIVMNRIGRIIDMEIDSAWGFVVVIVMLAMVAMVGIIAGGVAFDFAGIVGGIMGGIVASFVVYVVRNRFSYAGSRFVRFTRFVFLLLITVSLFLIYCFLAGWRLFV